jgi:hypothetical protein
MLHKMYGLWEPGGALYVVPRKLTWDFFRSLLEAATIETRQMVRQWGILHAGRSALGLAATLIFLWAQR